jgi:hypothetical protein
MAKKVTMEIESSGLNEGKVEKEVLFINGQRIEIKKDAEVQVRPIVKELYNECRANFKKGNTQAKELVLEG